MRPGGVVILSTPNISSLRSRWRWLLTGFHHGRKTPLGVNMAVRRRLIERIGGFRPDLGRNGRSLLGQEQAEFFYRSRQAGARGLYVPEMVLDHVVPASRLTWSYFWRWWFWKGVSHARVHRLHGRTELGIDLGDPECPAHDRVGCRAPSLAQDAAAAGEAHDVMYGEEIGLEAEFRDQREFVFNLRAHARGGRAVRAVAQAQIVGPGAERRARDWIRVSMFFDR